MAGRRGRPLEAAAPLRAVADGLIEVSPTAVYHWLLRTSRMANPDPSVHTQSRFGRRLGMTEHSLAMSRPVGAACPQTSATAGSSLWGSTDKRSNGMSRLLGPIFAVALTGRSSRNRAGPTPPWDC